LSFIYFQKRGSNGAAGMGRGGGEGGCKQRALWGAGLWGSAGI